jgi:hypothetical protein
MTPDLNDQEREIQAIATLPRDHFLAGPQGLRTCAAAFGDFAGLWETKVPASHLDTVCDEETGIEYLLVRCTCGRSTALELGVVCECDGECGRWFMPLADGVGVHRFAETD